MGFPIPLGMVASCALDLTYPHRQVTYFIMERASKHLVPWLGERWTWGGVLSNASGSGDLCLREEQHPASMRWGAWAMADLIADGRHFRPTRSSGCNLSPLPGQ